MAAGLALNVAAFAAAALCLHRLSVRTLGTGRLADLAALFFCLNPASVFYSAAYSEALFAAGTWAGLLLLPTHHWAGVAAFALAAAARSNGILAVWFPLHALLAAWQRRGGVAPPLRDALRAALSCCVILAPYIAMQGGLGGHGGGGRCLLHRLPVVVPALLLTPLGTQDSRPSVRHSDWFCLAAAIT